MKQRVNFPELPKGRDPQFPGEGSGRGEEEEVVVTVDPAAVTETESFPAQDIALDETHLLCQEVMARDRRAE